LEDDLVEQKDSFVFSVGAGSSMMIVVELKCTTMMDDDTVCKLL
jgi:hypothetical protein